jgi:histidinol-phosphate/aromatic aminotransferase/cobyric acid decarboxylase-like protein
MDNNPFWNKLTKALRDSIIDGELAVLDVNSSYFKDKEFNFAERIIIKNKLLTAFPAWVSDHFSGLENFKEKNITNGNTDALNLVMLGSKYSKIYTLPNEYIYYSHISKTLNIPQVNFNLNELSIIKNDGIVCLSVPASNDGEIESKQQVIDYCQEHDIPLFVDVAYCGLTIPNHITLRKSNNTYFAFSFSKTLGLAFNRIGLLYSNNEIASASLLNKLGYINLSGAVAAEHLMKKIPCNYVYDNYKEQYESICKTAGLTPTSCILFGHTPTKEKYCITEFYKLK